jgi:hypothetical protein
LYPIPNLASLFPEAKGKIGLTKKSKVMIDDRWRRAPQFVSLYTVFMDLTWRETTKKGMREWSNATSSPLARQGFMDNNTKQ